MDNSEDDPVLLKIRDRRLDSKNKILDIIKKHGEIRFKELVEESEFSNKWVSEILKDLAFEGLITKEISNITIDNKIKKNQAVYKLTEEGENVWKKAWHILHKITDLENNRAGYSHNLIYYGIETDLIMSQDLDMPNNLLLIIPELKAFILKTIFKRLENNTNIKAKGEFMINFDFDVNKLLSHLQEIIKFVEDLSKGNDIFESEQLANFHWKEKIIYLFDHLKEAEFFYYEDKNTLNKLIENAEKLIKAYDNDIIENFYQKGKGLDKEIYEKIKKDIENDVNPLNDKEIAEKLIKKSKIQSGEVVTEYLIFDYTNLLLAFNLTNESTTEKINRVVKEINNMIENNPFGITGNEEQ